MYVPDNQLVTIFLFLVGIPFSFSQEIHFEKDATKKDTINVVTDSVTTAKKDDKNITKDKRVYTKITNFFKKGKLTKNLSNSLFNSKLEPPQKNTSTEKPFDYSPFQGKIIRKIIITTLDPFGFDEKNLDKKPSNKWDIYGNALHNKTKQGTIKKMLLFSEKMPSDSLMLKESERILRDKSYIRRAMIRPVATQSKDSVDIQVNVLDSWSIFFASDLTDKRGWVRITERNMFGIGHQASVIYRQHFRKFEDSGKGFTYRAKNIGNSQIDAVTSYYTDSYENEYEKVIALERPFFSPYARWIGRVGAYEEQFKDGILIKDSIFEPYFKTRIYDFYGGFIIPFNDEKSKNINNFIISGRYKVKNYLNEIENQLNVDNYFSNEQLLLSKWSFNSTNFVQDRYIFKQGDIEDVSVGNSVFLTAGFLNKNNETSPYASIGFSFARYKEKGYFSSNFEIGNLFFKNRKNQLTIRAESIYFSNLFNAGSWNFRQFFKYSFVAGFGRSQHSKDRLSLNGDSGILGFESTILGTRKLVFTLQTQAYSPFYWLGFRFNPFLNVDVGFIGLDKTAFLKMQGFSKIGLGFYISNDYLAFQSFQFSLCYFPVMPSQGNHIFKITNIQNDDFRLQRFSHQAPNLISFY